MEETTITKIIVTGICFVIASFSSCTAGISYHDNVTMAEMVSEGADPIAARCAVKGSETSVCSVYATKH